MPTVVVTKNSNNLNHGGMFEPNTRTLELAVDYCGAAVSTPASLQLVINDLETLGWAISVGRPFAKPAQGLNPADRFELGRPADQTASESTLLPYVVKSYRGVMDGGSNKVWRISVDITLVTRNINLAEDFPGRNHSAVSISAQSRSTRAYRAGATLPTMTWDPSQDPGRFTNTWITCGQDDIGGDPIDINGEPLSMPVEQTSIVLSFVIREPYYSNYNSSTRTTGSMWTTWGKNPRRHLNSRNSEVLFGYQVGRLVVTDVTVTPLDMEFRRVDITLLDDEWYHFEQMPWSTAGVIPELNETCEGELTPPNLVVWHAKYVLWVTPIFYGFSWSTTDFPDDVWDFFTSAVTKA